MLAPDSEMDDLLMQPPTLTILPACIDCCYDETLLKLDKKNTIKIKFLLPLFPDLESLVYRKDVYMFIGTIRIVTNCPKILRFPFAKSFLCFKI